MTTIPTNVWNTNINTNFSANNTVWVSPIHTGYSAGGGGGSTGNNAGGGAGIGTINNYSINNGSNVFFPYNNRYITKYLVNYSETNITLKYDSESMNTNLTFLDKEHNNLGTLSFNEMVKYIKQLEVINEDNVLKEMWDELQFAIKLRGNHDYEEENLRGNGNPTK